MQLKYNNIKILLSLSFISLVLLFNACDNDDDDATAATQLESFGPSVNRGTDDLKFIGNNLNNVTAIVLPVGIEIPASSFKSISSNLIVITVPEDAVSGKVILKTPEGDIETKTDLSILEPITITSITPAKARPGDEITIEGTYLNLIEMATFKNNKEVASFTSQSKTTLKMIVPDDAQTGSVILTDGEVIPNAIESTMELEITLPVVTNLSSTLLKAGSQLTITGTDLDLTNEIRFGGDRSVTSFVSQTDTEIVVVVPANAEDGKIKLLPASGVATESSESLTMLLPTLATIVPNPVKNGGNITVTGTDLDLVTSVVFGGDKTGTIEGGGTSTQIIVKVPADATDGVVSFRTDANKSVPSDPLNLIVPTIATIDPTSVSTASNPAITINGTDLDLVSEIIFEGNWSTTTFTSSANSITVNVVPGSVSGKVKLVTTNGTEILSPDLTIIPDVPNITTVQASAFIGGYMTIEGTNMNVPAEITFPGGIVATDFGSKTSTLIEVRVPQSVSAGEGRIKFTTSKNEIYESPLVNFKFSGTEPIVDAALIINDFDEDGHNIGWDNWGGNVEEGNDVAVGISGKYLHGANASASGWTWIWGCNHDQLPKVSVTKADHVLKLDINITKPIPSNANFQIELGGSWIDLGNLGGTTLGWTTITYDLSSFGGLPDVIPGSGEWGMNLQAGTVDLTGLHIDNIRFQAK
jgi:hypothetical protein